MFDYKTVLAEQLETILPTYYELFPDSSTKTPCLTYIENNNRADEESDNLRYSTLSYQIKIWGKVLEYEELMGYANELDELMYSLGFKRVSYNELSYDNLIQLIFRYEGKGWEYLL